MPTRTEFTQQNGYLQAGILVAMADAAAGMAAWSLLAPGDNLLSTTITVSLMRAASGERFAAEGRVIKAGERLMFCEATVWGADDPDRKPVIVASMTMLVTTPKQAAGRD